MTCVADSALSELALVEPNLTSLAPVRFVPVIVTVVPPAAGPLVGSTFGDRRAPGCKCIRRRPRWRSCLRGSSRSHRRCPSPPGRWR